MNYLTDEERAAMRAAAEAAQRREPGATLALAVNFSIRATLSLLDERDALAAEVERLRALRGEHAPYKERAAPPVDLWAGR